MQSVHSTLSHSHLVSLFFLSASIGVRVYFSFSFIRYHLPIYFVVWFRFYVPFACWHFFTRFTLDSIIINRTLQISTLVYTELEYARVANWAEWLSLFCFAQPPRHHHPYCAFCSAYSFLTLSTIFMLFYFHFLIFKGWKKNHMFSQLIFACLRQPLDRNINTRKDLQFETTTNGNDDELKKKINKHICTLNELLACFPFIALFWL